jgi:hypothetical protein
VQAWISGLSDGPYIQIFRVISCQKAVFTGILARSGAANVTVTALLQQGAALGAGRFTRSLTHSLTHSHLTLRALTRLPRLTDSVSSLYSPLGLLGLPFLPEA